MCLAQSYLKLRKSVFQPEGQNSLFTLKSKPKFQNFRTMSKIYFLKTRFYEDHFCLLRRVHPRPRKPSSKPMKNFKLWAPLSSPYISPSLPFFSIFLSQTRPIAELPAELLLLYSLLIFSPKSPPNSTKLKIDHHHSTPCIESFLLALFSRRFVANDLSSSH